MLPIHPPVLRGQSRGASPAKSAITGVNQDFSWQSYSFPDSESSRQHFAHELKKPAMIKTAFHLFLLRPQPLAACDFPRWQSVLAICLIGLLGGLSPSARNDFPALSNAPGQLAGLTLYVTLVSFGFVQWFLRRWMLAGGRWDGQGHFFNLLVASFFVTDLMHVVLQIAGVSRAGLLPLWGYSFWVAARALSGAIPQVSFRHALLGIVLSLPLAFFAAFIALVVLLPVLAGSIDALRLLAF
jgi:hypothetical protein